MSVIHESRVSRSVYKRFSSGKVKAFHKNHNSIYVDGDLIRFIELFIGDDGDEFETGNSCVVVITDVSTGLVGMTDGYSLISIEVLENEQS